MKNTSIKVTEIKELEVFEITETTKKRLVISEITRGDKTGNFLTYATYYKDKFSGFCAMDAAAIKAIKEHMPEIEKLVK